MFFIFERMPRPLLWTVGAHLLLAIVCAAALQVDLPPIGGVHPALKPFKFAVSIAFFLATMAVLLPQLSLSPALRGVLAWTLATTMVLEMIPIVVQSLRGTRSHFNQAHWIDEATWTLMVLAIVVATAAMTIIVWAASLRPLLAAAGPLSPQLTFAWRAGLWLLLLAPVTGFAMGARLAHSVGGADGGPGLPLLNWSVVHGDLRVAHFFALHAFQLLPLLAWFAERKIPSPGLRWGLIGVGVLVMGVLCLGTLVQALAGQPWVRPIEGAGRLNFVLTLGGLFTGSLFG